MSDVVMPQMGESIVEGTLTRWLKKVGDLPHFWVPIRKILPMKERGRPFKNCLCAHILAKDEHAISHLRRPTMLRRNEMRRKNHRLITDAVASFA